MVEFEWEMDWRNAGVQFDLYRIGDIDEGEPRFWEPNERVPVVTNLTIAFPICRGRTDTDHYYYTAKILVSKGDTALPYLRIRVRKNYTGTLYDYVYDRYITEPYQPLKDYTSGLGLPKSGGMGYIGAYTNLSDKRDYQFRMVYFKVQNTVVEFRLETTKATYPQMEKEFESILGSLTF